MVSRTGDNSTSERRSDDKRDGIDANVLAPYVVERRTRCLVCDDLLVEPDPVTDEDELEEFLADSPSAQGLVCRGCRRFWEFDVLELRPPAAFERRVILGCRILAGLFLSVIPAAIWFITPTLIEFLQINPQKSLLFISMFMVCSAMSAGLLLLVRKPFVALVTEEGIDWRRWTQVFNHQSWGSITRIHYDRDRNDLALVDSDETRLSRIEQIILAGRSPDEITHIAAELRRRWLAAIYALTLDQATRLDASKLDTARLLRLRQKGKPRICPTCRRDLTTVPRRSSDCPICRFAGDADTLIYRHRDSRLSPRCYAAFAAIITIAMATFVACREGGLSTRAALIVALCVTSLAPMVYWLDRRKERRSPRLVINRDGILWTTPKRKTVRLPWAEIETLLSNPHGYNNCLRMKNGDMKRMPWYFRPKGFPASDFVALIELARREYSCRARETKEVGAID